jgi:voltage-gated potassium channel
VTPARESRRDLRTVGLYALGVLRSFRLTLVGLVSLVLVGGLLFAVTPDSQFGGARPPVFTSFYAAWMALVGEPVLSPPAAWYLAVLEGVYPLLGLMVVGEGIVRFALLMVSRDKGEAEWMKVMASTYRDHVILCGLGHLGYRVLGQLLQTGAQVVAIENDPDARFLALAKATGIPVLLRDMKDDKALVEAGVAHARVVILATNDDMANLEAALDARRMNPKVRVVLRLYDQEIAAKIKGAFAIDAAFSSSALAAPLVAAMSLDVRVLGTYSVAGVPHVAAEVVALPGSGLIGRRVSDVETTHEVRVLARQREGEPPSATLPGAQTVIEEGDTLVVHAASDRIGRLAGARMRVGTT